MVEIKKFTKIGVASGDYTSMEVARRNIQVRNGIDAYTPLTFENNPFNHYIKNSKNILDLGCGMGRMTKWILQNTTANYYGVDPNPNMLKYFWEYNKQLIDFKNRIYIFNDIYDSEFRKQKYDVIISFFVFQHIGYRVSENIMNIDDITQEILKNTHNNTIWILLEHENEEAGWISRWSKSNKMNIKLQFKSDDIYPDIKDHTLLVTQFE